MTGDSVFLWQVLEDGQWGTIMAEVIGGMPTMLQARDLRRAQILGIFAVAHHDATGKPVRCARFDLAEVVRSMP